jgi:class 3 adenylate cyclase/tetratricopeptide (TPR) repeat protein
VADSDQTTPSRRQDATPGDPEGRAEGERRQITVLFADLAGFTAFTERSGDEAAYTLMQRISALMTDVVHEQGGTVKNFTGDGIMALFGVPVALEDAPIRACKAALLIHKRLAVASPEIERRYGLRPQMRIGVNTGPAIVGSMRSGDSTAVTALGDTVNLASRLQSFADPGGVLLSEATHRLVDGLVESASVGEREIKGKAERQRVYRLDRVREGATPFDAAVSRGLTAYVGRSRELDVLERCLRESETGLRVIDIVGEPGIGKSRLLHEFRKHLPSAKAFVLSGNCSLHGQQIPFLPFIEIARGSFRLEVGEDEAEAARKVDKGLNLLGLASDENVGLLLNLLGLRIPEGALEGLDGVLIGLRTRDLLLKLLKERCRTSRVVMFVEDLHWIDSGSAELLGRVIAEDISRLLLVHTRRPEYLPPWRDEQRVTTLALQPLSAAETSEIVRSRFPVLDPPLARLIADRAEGNPLFAEEIVRYLLDRGIVRQIHDAIQYDAADVSAALPGSIQSLLAARIDCLAADDRALLQAAAAIGRRFRADLLAVIAKSRDVEARLAAIQSLDLVHADGPSGDFMFKHALVQDALYNSLLGAARADLHLRVATEIERRADNRLSEVAEDLAYHFGCAGATMKAFIYNVMAGNKCLGVYSVDEAERYLRKALEIADSHVGAATEFDIAEAVERMAYLLNLDTRPTSLCELLDRYLSRIEGSGDSSRLVMALHHYSAALAIRGLYERAHAVSRRALEIADRLGDPGSRAYASASFVFSSTLVAPIPFDAFVREGDGALRDAEEKPDGYIETWAPFVVSWDYLHRGLTDQARSFANAVISRGRARNDPRALGIGLWLLGWFDIMDERFEDALEHAEEGISASLSALDRMVNNQVKGIALVSIGRVSEGVPLLSEIRRECVRNDWVYNLVGTDLILSISAVLEGRFAEGVKGIERYIAWNDREKYRLGADWGRIYLAEVYLELLAGKQRPPFRVLVRNSVFLIRTLPFAARRALDLLTHAAKNAQFSPEGVFLARINMDLGLLHKVKKRRDDARHYLEKAREFAAPRGAATMLAKIDAALADLA